MNTISLKLNAQICLLLALLTLWQSACLGNHLDEKQQPQLSEPLENKFYYFGYGSNMLAKRIHIQNPTAEIVGPALLDDYRLDFATISAHRWRGAVATVVPTTNWQTWGTLWTINLTNLADIDDQEGVHLNLYEPLTVSVRLHGNGTEIQARVYVLVEQPKSNLHEMAKDQVPEDRKPSKTYLQVLVKGAIESGIPNDYVQFLKNIKHNNNTVKSLEEILNVQSVEL